MTLKITTALFAALLLPACSTGAVHVVVRNAGTGLPVPGASVALTYSTPDLAGLFGGRVKRVTTITDGDGKFVIRGSAISLDVSAPDGQSASVDMCPSSPMTVYVGGAYTHIRTNRLLVLSASGKPSPSDLSDSGRLHARDLGLMVTPAQDDHGETLSIEAEGGVAFVPGTGAIPTAPTLPYPAQLSFNPRRDCGWIFVQRGGRVAAIIKARPPSGLSTPSGYQETTLVFSELPD